MPLPEQPADSQILPLGDVNQVTAHISSNLVTTNQIKAWTKGDPILSQVHHFILHGWPTYNKEEPIQTYFNRKDELSAVDGCILWGARVVIPPQGQQMVIQ